MSDALIDRLKSLSGVDDCLIRLALVEIESLRQQLADAFEAGRVAEREECAKNAGEFARKWWSIHCATNRHLETTRAAHDDFCALQIVIRARSAK